LVHSPDQKLALSKYCLGPNAQRVLDSDCTAVFLADRKVLQTLPRFGRFMASIDAKNRSPTLLTKVYIALFSSGYPFLPRILASTISFLVRTGVSFCNIFTTLLFQYPLPTLSSAETWSCKQTTMLAMTYMLACSSRGLATIPMEGINAGGIRAVVGAPHRYAVPVIVSTGLPRLIKDDDDDDDDEQNNNAVDDNEDSGKQRRYPLNEMVFGDSFNQRMQISGAAAAAAT
jgi:nitroreductase